MFPLIYANNETSFASNGLGALSDCIRCEVTEELNGIFEMELEVPITGNHYSDIKQRRIIYAMTPGGKQPFEVYRISKPINGVVTVYCQHISYRLLKMTASLFSSPTCAAAGAELATQATTAEGATWTFWTDKDIHSMYRVAYPKTIRNCFGGEQGSMIQLYGGELEFDHRTIKLHTHRGANNGVQIRYGKNMSDINDDTNAADVYKSVIPYWYQEGGNCIVGTKVSKTGAFDASFDLTIPLDCSSEFQAEPTAAQLTAYAQTYIDARTPTEADETITVSFVPLAGSSGYEGLEELETVNIGDTVTVINPVLGISTQKKANKYVYDALNERYISVELGAKKSTLGKTISDELGRELEGVNNQLAGKVSETEMTEAIEAATDLITGGTGGYVFTGRNNDGEPNEIFIMDTNNAVTAQNVIRLNKNGIGFSNTGINGPFTNAWTIDGHLIADFIYSGTLQSNDANTNFSLNLNTGETNMKKGSIRLGYDSSSQEYNFSVSDTGTLTMNKGSISLGSSSSDSNYYFHVSTTGALQWASKYSSMTNEGQLSIERGSINLGYNSTGDFYKFALDNNGVLTTRYADGDTAWTLNADSLRIYSNETGDAVGELTYNKRYIFADNRDADCFEFRYASGAALWIGEGIGSKSNVQLAIEHSRITLGPDIYQLGKTIYTPTITWGRSGYLTCNGTVGFEYVNNAANMIMRNDLSGSCITIDSTQGNVHVYGDQQNSIVQLHAGGGRVLHLGPNGLHYYDGSTWSTLKLSNGQDSK